MSNHEMPTFRDIEVAASFEQLLEAAHLPEDTVDICLRGDLVAKHHALQQQLAGLPESSPGAGSLAGDPRRTELLASLDTVATQMRRATQTFVLRALSKKTYSQFIAEHPPRPEDRRDMILGYNQDTMAPALLRVCIVEPSISPQQWDRLEQVLSPGEWGKLYKAASDLNFAEVHIPFSSAASPNPTSSGSE